MRKVLAGLTAAAMVAGAPVALVAAAVATPAAAQSWSVTTQAADGFAVELPGTPAVRRYDQDVGGGASVPIAEYTLAAGGGEFMVGSSNFGLDPTAEQLQSGYASALDGALSADGGTQTWRRARTVSGFAGMEMEYTHKVGEAVWKSRVLVVFARRRFFTLSARMPITAPAAATERAFNSFQLL